MADTLVSVGTHGRVRGRRGSDGVCRYLGIPYAEPPTGDRRWKKPTPLPKSFSYETAGEPRDCTEFGNTCPQEIYILDGKPFNELFEGKVSLGFGETRKVQISKLKRMANTSHESIRKTA